MTERTIIETISPASRFKLRLDLFTPSEGGYSGQDGRLGYVLDQFFDAVN